MALTLIGDGVDIEDLHLQSEQQEQRDDDREDEDSLSALLPQTTTTTQSSSATYNTNKNANYEQPVNFSGTTTTTVPRSRSDSGAGFLRRAEDSLASMGSLVDHLIFHRVQQEREPSRRSQQRYRLNIVLGTALFVTLLALLAVVGWTCVMIRRQILEPARQQALLEKEIRQQAARDAALVQKCAGVSWQTACSRLTGAAGARRQRQRRLEDDLENVVQDDDYYDNSPSDTDDTEENIELKFLHSDDITVTYDANCIREYRLTLMWNITFPYRANQLLTSGGDRFTMALFIQHGALRDAADYFCSFMQLMHKQTYRNFNEILIIAPHFQYGHDDYLHPRDAFWNTSKPWGDWRVGAESDPKCCGKSGRTISSFAILDTMLAYLTNKQLYPNLRKISFLGHSAGGQMVQRYAVMSTLAALWDLEADVDLRFVIANPSSYTYLDNRRFEYNCGNCDCNRRNCTCDKGCAPTSSRLGVPYRHGVGTFFPCYQWNYDRWPYGLGDFTDTKRGYYIPYALRDGLVGPERALRVYRKLDVVYMVGQNDTCNDGLPTCDASCWKRDQWLPGEGKCFRNQMDTRCPAMLQGPCRRTRAHNYMKFLQQLYSHPTHTLWEIPGVGHNATAIFGSDIGLEVLFGP